MILSKENVNDITLECFWGNGKTKEEIEKNENDPDRIDVETMRFMFSFSKKKLDYYKNDILSMIDRIFGGGGYLFGYKFLNEIQYNEVGGQWGDLSDAEEIVALGIAVGKFTLMDEKSRQELGILYPVIYVNRSEEMKNKIANLFNAMRKLYEFDVIDVEKVMEALHENTSV